MDNQVKPIVKGIIDYLKVQNSLHLLPQVILSLQEKDEELTNENRAVVTSSYKLSAPELLQIQDALNIIFRRRLSIVNQVDPSLIAGLKIRVEDKLIDLSLDKTLDGLKNRLEND
jgi:F-type H+-transporting ATPase subunit delta